MVGIITFHASHNCGSILQAYALQRTLKNKFAVDNEIIDFSNAGQRNYYSIFVKNDSVKHLVKNMITVLFYRRVKKENETYEECIHRLLELSDRSYKEEAELSAVEEQYEAFICGSDQVWNVTCTDADDAYFLSFVKNKKKIAYAASLGAKNINRYASNPEKYKKYLGSFAGISVREGNGKKWISELIDNQKNVSICLDPTLLLKKSEWEQITSKRLIEGDYIFYYAFNYTPEVNKTVQQISQTYGMPVYMFDVKSWGVKANFRYGFRLVDAYGPEAFLSLVKNAKLVLTTSFHGTVFSTIFEKTFWYLNSSMHSKDDDRASYLLDQLALTNRLISLEAASSINMLEEPCFDESRIQIENLKDRSFAFLDRNIRS